MDALDELLQSMGTAPKTNSGKLSFEDMLESLQAETKRGTSKKSAPYNSSSASVGSGPVIITTEPPKNVAAPVANRGSLKPKQNPILLNEFNEIETELEKRRSGNFSGLAKQLSRPSTPKPKQSPILLDDFNEIATELEKRRSGNFSGLAKRLSRPTTPRSASPAPPDSSSGAATTNSNNNSLRNGNSSGRNSPANVQRSPLSTSLPSTKTASSSEDMSWLDDESYFNNLQNGQFQHHDTLGSNSVSSNNYPNNNSSSQQTQQQHVDSPLLSPPLPSHNYNDNDYINDYFNSISTNNSHNYNYDNSYDPSHGNNNISNVYPTPPTYPETQIQIQTQTQIRPQTRPQSQIQTQTQMPTPTQNLTNVRKPVTKTNDWDEWGEVLTQLDALSDIASNPPQSQSQPQPQSPPQSQTQTQTQSQPYEEEKESSLEELLKALEADGSQPAPPPSQPTPSLRLNDNTYNNTNNNRNNNNNLNLTSNNTNNNNSRRHSNNNVYNTTHNNNNNNYNSNLNPNNNNTNRSSNYGSHHNYTNNNITTNNNNNNNNNNYAPSRFDLHQRAPSSPSPSSGFGVDTAYSPSAFSKRQQNNSAPAPAPIPTTTAVDELLLEQQLADEPPMPDPQSSYLGPPMPGQCAKCRKMILREEGCLQAMNNTYHPDCWVCERCSLPIGTNPFYPVDGAPVCEHCYVAQTGTICDACSQPVLEYGVQVGTRTYHRLCVKCVQCRRSLAGLEVFERGGYPVCQNCHITRPFYPCAGCSLPISGEILVAMDKNWHQQCFVCTTCKQPFDAGFYRGRDGNPYCQWHVRNK